MLKDSTIRRRRRLLLPLYRAWAEGGSGLSVTGNVMVDGRARSEPGNVVVEDTRDMPFLQTWAREGSRNGTALWMRINHPGKQAMVGLNHAHGTLTNFRRKLRGLFHGSILQCWSLFETRGASDRPAQVAGELSA